MAASLVNLLMDFSPELGGESINLVSLQTPKPKPKLEVDVELEQICSLADIQSEEVRLAEERAREEERESARKKLEDTLATERAQYEEEMKTQRMIWAEQEAEQLSLQVAAALSNLERVLSERVANILHPFISAALWHQTIAQFEDSLSALLTGSASHLIKITGPEDVLSTLKDKLGERGKVIEYLPNEGVEVTVICQDTSIQTQFASWSDRLNEIIKAG